MGCEQVAAISHQHVVAAECEFVPSLALRVLVFTWYFCQAQYPAFGGDELVSSISLTPILSLVLNLVLFC